MKGPIICLLVQKVKGKLFVKRWRFSISGNIPRSYSLICSQPWKKCGLVQVPYDDNLFENIAKVSRDIGLRWNISYPLYNPSLLQERV